MDNQQPNRVEIEVGQWRSREERFNKLFSFGISSNKPLLREKLLYYDRIAAKYKNTPDPDERFALQVLKQERKDIEKKLYPNPLIRLLRRLLVVPFRNQITIRQNARQVAENSQSLLEQLRHAGFTGLSTKLNEQIRSGQAQFSIPLSYYINDKVKLDHQLAFTRDKIGNYHFEGFKTALTNEAKPQENREQYFIMGPGSGVDVKQAYNLLEGRAICKQGNWSQLDFNDKDMHGNYRIKEFHLEFGYDIEKQLRQLPLKEMNSESEAEKLLETLKAGGRQLVSFSKDGSERNYYIEANPQFKSVNVYDEHFRRVTLGTALGNKTAESVRQAEKAGQEQEKITRQRNNMRVI